MNISIIHKFLPFIIFILSTLSAASYPKVFYIGLPAMAICFHLYYPGSYVIQIALLIIWGLFLVGTYRAKAFSVNDVSENKVLFVVLIALSVVMLIILLIWWSPTLNILGIIGLMTFGTFIFYHGFVKPITLYVIAPLFVKKKTTMNTTLGDYYKATTGPARSKIWHSYIRFLNDPLIYEIGVLGFRRYRNKVEVPFSYIRCECLFGVNYIYSIRQLSQTSGLPSRWESSPTTKIENKIKKYALLFAIGSIIMGLIIVGIVVLCKS